MENMTQKSLTHFPFFAPPCPPHPHRPATEIRFSRWYNANAEKFIRQERTQKEFEDQIRFQKRFNAIERITTSYNPAPPEPVSDTFKSIGTPSAPSRPSIPGKFSKYSKNPTSPRSNHPAFRPILRPRKIPIQNDESENNEEIDEDKVANELKKAPAKFNIDENGVSYEFPEAPFVYQYSYTEAPKVKPLKLREPLVSPFGPESTPRPWTGRKPLPPSKKKLPEFDSFQLPPPHKKGVKPVQAPGPFLAGSGPKYVRSREEILGEPLTKKEIEELINSCRKSSRQLNIGRDGLTHNMLENIHAHWKRKRVCKIKCKGVCTVDMDNVRQKLEEKTGGKIIYSTGGVIFVFRGRNYNYKTRPKYPLMLWKPVTPVYPRLIKRVPEGLTLEEATEMRKKGRSLTPICKLAKNGVYCNLVRDVREAFEACELVRIDCQGLNGSDYRRIGAKLQDLVPCVLISFEREHILMWRGHNWKSSLALSGENQTLVKELEVDDYAVSSSSDAAPSAAQDTALLPCIPSSSIGDSYHDSAKIGTSSAATEVRATEVNLKGCQEGPREITYDVSGLSHVVSPPVPSVGGTSGRKVHDRHERLDGNKSEAIIESSEFITTPNELLVSEASPKSRDGDEDQSHCSSVTLHNSDLLQSESEDTDTIIGLGSQLTSVQTDGVLLLPETLQGEIRDTSSSVHQGSPPWTEGVFLLRKLAIESGSALILDDSSLDPDIVYQRAVALAKSAPPGPVFEPRPRKLAVQDNKGYDNVHQDDKESVNPPPKEGIVPAKGGKDRKFSKNQKMKNIKVDYLNFAPRGSLGIDELAKLLS